MFQRFQGLLPIIGLIAIVAVVAAVYRIVHTVRMNKELGNRTGNKWIILTVLCAVAALISWIFNFGWLRVFLSLFGFPLFYGAFFCFANCMAAARTAEMDAMKKYIPWSCITYLLAYLCFPDGGDVGEMYVFFGLIRDDGIAHIAMVVSIAAFVANIVLLILEIVIASIWKKQTPSRPEETE